MLLAALVLFTAGFGLLVAALNVYFRDVEHILTALSLPWFFLTPIFYSFDMVKETTGNRQWAVELLHYGNPVSPFVIAIRGALFEGTWPFAGDVAYCAAAAVLSIGIGIAVFRRLEHEMAVEL